MAITNFKRPKHLNRAIESVVNAGIKNIVISTMEPDADVNSVIGRWCEECEKRGIKFIVTGIEHDLGCNELWLRAAYYCETKHIIILHDDDFIDRSLGEVYETQIGPFLEAGDGFATWRAALAFEDGSRKPTEFWSGPTRVSNSSELREWLLVRKKLSLSPIISVFERETLIQSLKWSDLNLTDNECLYRYGMLLGTEIIAYLHHCARFKRWLYVDRVMSYYGAHGGSGTVEAQKTGNLSTLFAGYDKARELFEKDPNCSKSSKIILTSCISEPYNEDERIRLANAHSTWKFLFNQGDVLDFPLHESQIRSSKKIGDERGAPYLKDFLSHGMRFATAYDIVGFVNSDICATTDFYEKARRSINPCESSAVLVQRRSFKPVHGRQYKHIHGAKTDGGIDMILVSKWWLNENIGKIPDLLIGRRYWDNLMALMIKNKASNMIYHEPHKSYWQIKPNCPGELHNKQLLVEYVKKHRIKNISCKL